MLAACAGLVVSLAGCGGGSGHSPTAPTAVSDRGASPTAGGPVATPGNDHPQPRVPLPEPGGIHASDVAFPPRNEPYQFRLALEDVYRDRLRRPLGSSFVDAEGTVVWTQEYLRYRVNGCSHNEATVRVLDQVDGIRTAPVCSTTAQAIFPPRNEPYDFMLLLESHYQVYLGRRAGSTYVDVLGNVVWTQEYLRYRTTGCPHSVAQQKVFDQIDGRGVSAGCNQNRVAASGVWDGTYQRGGGFVLWLDETTNPPSGRYTGDTQSITDYPVGVTVSGRDYSFDLYFGDTGIRLNARWDGAETMSGTTQGMGLGPFTMRRRP